LFGYFFGFNKPFSFLGLLFKAGLDLFWTKALIFELIDKFQGFDNFNRIMPFNFFSFWVGFSLGMREETNFSKVAEAMIGIAMAKIDAFAFSKGDDL
jgi:hypothetical protein